MRFVIAIILVTAGWWSLAFAEERHQPTRESVPLDTTRPSHLDSLQRKSASVKTRQNTFPLTDTTKNIPKTFERIANVDDRLSPSVTSLDWTASNERSLGDALMRLPGVYSLGLGFAGQPEAAYAPIDPMGLKIEQFGRDFSDPITRQTLFEFFPVRGIEAISGGPCHPGQRIVIEPVVAKPRRPLMFIDYRDGYYAHGRVDWRFFNPVNQTDLWGAGVAVTQSDGRYDGTGINRSGWFLHYRHEPVGKTSYIINASQFIDSVGIANTTSYRHLRRNDIDLVISSGDGSLPEKDSVVTANANPLSRWKIGSYWTSATSQIKPYPYNDGKRYGISVLGEKETRLGVFQAKAESELTSAIIANNGKRKEQSFTSKLTYRFDRDYRIRAEVNGIWKRDFSTQWSGMTSVQLPENKYGNLEGWIARTVRFPTLEERFGRINVAGLEHPLDPATFRYGGFAAFIGNEQLTPVTSSLIGLQYHKQIRGVDIALYGVSAKVANPIVTAYTKFNTLFKFHPVNRSEINWQMLTVSASVYPYGWGIVKGVFNTASTSHKNLFVPNSWGYLDLGAHGSLLHNAFQWQGITRVRYIGKRDWVFVYDTTPRNPHGIVDILLSAKIYQMRLNWGVTNLLHEEYEELPGYPTMHREEVWGISWNIWD